MLSTTVFYQGESLLTDGEWFAKLNLGMSGDENKIDVTSGDFSKRSAEGNKQTKNIYWLDTIFNGITVFDSLGNGIGRRSSSDRNVILYVPEGVRLEIESQYAEVTVEDDMGEVYAKISNGGFTMANADQLQSTVVYGRIYAGNVKQATLSITNGKLSAKNVGKLFISSKNSSVVLEKVDLLSITRSQLDQYEIEEAQTITGQKDYGNLWLSTLTGSVDISGINADVKIRSIDPSVTAVKINTQYADLSLPLRKLKNYTIAFEGSNGNVYTPFEKTYGTKTSFSASLGSTDAKPTLFNLNCQNCSVDFK